MNVVIQQEPSIDLAEYASVPIAFDVTRVLEITAQADGSFTLSEHDPDAPYIKDYDALEHPTAWGRFFDLTNWGVLAARSGGGRIGGAIVAFDTPGVDMLEGRRDLAVLWDIRVAPEARGRGIGSMLFDAAEAWAVARGCRELKVETQNINVAACALYRRAGCALRAVNDAAYPGLPEETQLLWYKNLSLSSNPNHRRA